MALPLLGDGEIIQYGCSCGELKPIYRLYFCRHCLKTRCGFCVSHEIDAYYCVCCCENYPPAEAWMRKNGCGNCYNCPNCNGKLTVRMTSKQKSEQAAASSSAESATTGDGKPGAGGDEAPKKVYYQICFTCQWSTRDSGLPDSTVAFGGWPERTNPFMDRMKELMEYYQLVDIVEQWEKEKKEKKGVRQRRTETHISGLTKAQCLKKAGLNPADYGLGKWPELRKPAPVQPAVATSEINDLPSDIYTSVPDLTKTPTVQQKLGQPETPAIDDVKQLLPYKRPLSIKTSQRCRSCEHNVSKPEFNPASIKFKIQSSAYYHVPDIKIRKCDKLSAGKVSELTLKFTNPTQHQTVLTLTKFQHPQLKQADSVEEKQQEQLEATSLESERQKKLTGRTSKNRSSEINPRPYDVVLNSNIQLPAGQLMLPQRDDAAEYDDTGDNQGCNDDPSVVWWKGNKIAVRFEVTPGENVQAGEDVVVGFIMNYVYTNTILQKNEQNKTELCVNVVLNLGQLLDQQVTA